VGAWDSSLIVPLSNDRELLSQQMINDTADSMNLRTFVLICARICYRTWRWNGQWNGRIKATSYVSLYVISQNSNSYKEISLLCWIF